MRKLCVLLCVMAIFFTGCQNTEKENQKTTTQSPTTTQSTSLNTDSLADKVDSYVGSGGEVPAGNATSREDGQTEIPETGDAQQTDSTQSGGDGIVQEGNTEADRKDFDERDDTVYATTNVVVRNKPSIAGDPVMNLKKGKSVHRVGYSAGWTKVEVNGYFYYIATQYLSETP